MSTKRYGAIALLIAATVVLSGCAASRSEIKMTAAAVPTTSTVTKARAVVIRSVKDERAFEKAPSVASTPSLGGEGADKASLAIKERAVARKRNSYGMAMGDVLLEEGQSVTGLVRENLTGAFQQMGYRVTDEASAGRNPLLVDVQIKKFWSWMQPGFWALTLNSNIETTIRVSGANAGTTVSVHVQDSRQMATDGAWMEILDKALTAFRAQAVQKLQGPPF